MVFGFWIFTYGSGFVAWRVRNWRGWKPWLTASFSAAPTVPAADSDFGCDENDGPDWPAGSLADHTGLPGATTLGAFYLRYATIEQLDPCVGILVPNPLFPGPGNSPKFLIQCNEGTTGAQGGQMSFQATGCDAAILDVTATQTDIADGDIASCESGLGGSGGFDATELTFGPPFGDPGNEGAVHAIVLHLKKGTTLDPSSFNNVPATGPE